MKKISIGVCCYNEEENVELMYRALTEQMQKLPEYDYEILFEDNEKRETMNKLTFKYVGQKTKELILENQDKEFIVLDFPLLYEGKFDKICNYIIGVIADEETKIFRVTERDRITNAQALSRLNVQIDEEKLKEKADYIVDNSNNTRYITLVNDVVRLIHKIKKDEEEKKKTKK